jgi:hypothetical protein
MPHAFYEPDAAGDVAIEKKIDQHEYGFPFPYITAKNVQN